MFGPFKLFDRLAHGWFGYISWDVARYKNEKFLLEQAKKYANNADYENLNEIKKSISMNATVCNDVKHNLRRTIYSLEPFPVRSFYVATISLSDDKTHYNINMYNTFDNLSLGSTVQYTRLGGKNEAESYCNVLYDFIDCARASNNDHMLSYGIYKDCTFNDNLDKTLHVTIHNSKH